MSRQIKVDIVGNSKPFTNELDKAIGKVSGFGDRMRALGGGSLGKGLAVGAGIASFNLLTSAIEVGVSKLDEFHNAYLADQESQLRLQNILQNTTKNYQQAVKAAEAFAGAQQQLGFEDDSVRDSLGQLVGITHDLKEAQKLSSIAMDLARAKNIDLAQATDTVARAYTGVARGLTLVGIDARGASTGLELVNRIAENTKGAAATYARSGAGRIAAANAKMQDTFEKLGYAIDQISQVVIPIMAAGLGGIVDFLGEAIKAGQDFVGFLNTTLGPALTAIGNIASTVFNALYGVLNAAKGLLGVKDSLSRANGTGLPQSTTTGGVTSTTYAGHFLAPVHHAGGVVAGPYGSDQLIMAQAGERIIPTGQSAAQVININIASFIGSDRDIDRFADRLAFRLRATSLS